MPTINQLLIAEATEYEFKAALESNKPRSLLKTVSAFANGVGGSIYIGVSDDGVAIGLDNPQQTAERVSELIKARIEPAIKNVVLEPLLADGKHILRVQVSSGANTPYYYTGDGNKLAYYHIGNESVPVPAAILNELVLKGLHQTFDAIETKYLFSDYSYTLFEATYKQKTGNTVDKPRDYHSFDMLNDDGALTFVGALFADQCPIYQSRVFCTRWNGLKKSGLYVDALDSDEFQSNAISLLNDSLKFVRHNSSVKWKKTGTGRIEMPDYPSAAVHETLVNALVHRDYMIQGSEIHVDMYDDRMEIVSPGGMPDGKRIQDLNIDDVPSIRRNPIICDIFSRLKLMERRGSGLRKIIDEYTEDAAPVFRSTEQSFIVTLKNLNYGFSMPNAIDDGIETESNGIDGGVETEPNGIDDGIETEPNGIDGGIEPEPNAIDDGIETGSNGIDGGIETEPNGIDDGIEKHTVEIISVLCDNSKITQKQLAVEIGLSVRTIARELKRLRDKGVITRIGSDRAGYWEVVKRMR